MQSNDFNGTLDSGRPIEYCPRIKFRCTLRDVGGWVRCLSRRVIENTFADTFRKSLRNGEFFGYPAVVFRDFNRARGQDFRVYQGVRFTALFA